LAPEYAFGGQEVQRSLLEAEGVTFKINGLINMEDNLWKL
jgi:methylated-DNA-protein-cysteine methyltransferase related protein